MHDDVFTCYTPLPHVTSFDHSCVPCIYIYINMCIYVYIRHDLLMCDDVFMYYTTLLHVTSFDHSCAPCLFHLCNDAFTWHTRETVALPAYEYSQHTNTKNKKNQCVHINRHATRSQHPHRVSTRPHRLLYIYIYVYIYIYIYIYIIYIYIYIFIYFVSIYIYIHIY